MAKNRRVVGREPKSSASWRCRHEYADGQRCKNPRWAGKKWCFQHDPEAAALRAKAARTEERVQLGTVADVQKMLGESLADLRGGRIGPGEAYARGYLTQLALAALGLARKERKLDVKHFWEMVELGAVVEKAARLQNEREKEAMEKEAEEAESAGSAGDKEGGREDDDEQADGKE